MDFRLGAKGVWSVCSAAEAILETEYIELIAPRLSQKNIIVWSVYDTERQVTA